MRKVLVSISIALLTSVQFVNAQAVRPFEKGDRVVFLGNSITDGGRYHSYIWLYYMTRFPDREITVFNAGIGGDKASDMYKRFDTDVLPKSPNYLLLSFGMNDTGYDGYNGSAPQDYAKEQVETAKNAYGQLEQKIKEIPNLKVGIIGSSPYDETVKITDNKPLKGKNEAMPQLISFQKSAAHANGWGFVDFNNPVTAINEEWQKKDSTFTISGGDRIHPDSDGHMVMAYLFLKEQGFAGTVVADVEIDAQKGKTTKSENSRISSLKIESGVVSFDYLASSLPYPLDTVPRNWMSKRAQYDAVKYVPFIKEMNQELLTIKGLKGRYRIKIDKEVIGEWDSQDIEKGINLAEISLTPQYQQAISIMHLNEERWNIERRLRQYYILEYVYLQRKGLMFSDNREVLDNLAENIESDYLIKYVYDNYTKAMFPAIRDVWQQQIDLIVSKIYEINKPVPRKVEIIKIG